MKRKEMYVIPYWNYHTRYTMKMEKEKRSNGGYEIIESCTIGSTELVIGHNPKAPNPYVCWYCKGGGNYF